MSAVFLGFHHNWSVERYENREKCDVTLTWQPNFLTSTIFSWQWRTFALSNNGRGHVAAARSEWCLTLTPNNTKTIERMTYHCFLRPIRRDLTSSSCTTEWKKRMGYRFVPAWIQPCTGNSYMSILLSFFFLPFLQDHGLLRSRNRATIAT